MRWLSRGALACAAVIGLAGCGSLFETDDEQTSEAPACEKGSSQPCTCLDGTESVQYCELSPTDSSATEYLPCYCPNDPRLGAQEQDAGAVGPPPVGSCSQEGAVEVCSCCPGSDGTRTCAGGFWGECTNCVAPAVGACVHGATMACSCSDTVSQGVRTCNSGCWTTCENCTAPGTEECVHGQTVGCDCPGGGSGSKTCVNGVWGTCDNCGVCPDGYECFETISGPKPCVLPGASQAPSCTTDADCAELDVTCQNGLCWRYCSIFNG